MDEFVSKSDVITILYELKDIPHLNAGYIQDAIRKVRMLPNQEKNLHMKLSTFGVFPLVGYLWHQYVPLFDFSTVGYPAEQR